MEGGRVMTKKTVKKKKCCGENNATKALKLKIEHLKERIADTEATVKLLQKEVRERDEQIVQIKLSKRYGNY